MSYNNVGVPPYDCYETAREKIEFLDDIDNFYYDDKSDEQLNKTSDCATFWNICNTIQGLPILTIPYIVLVGGWYSILAILIVALLTDFACVLLYESLKEHNSNLTLTSNLLATSYEDLGEIAFGKKGRKLLFFCMFLQTIAVASIYPLLVGSMLESVFGNQFMYLWEWVFVGSVFFIPSCFVKNLEQVSWTSVVTVISAKIVFIVLVVYSFQMYHSWTVANLNDFDLFEFPGAIAILLSCYLAQPFIPSISSSMARPENFKWILHSAVFSMTLLNIIVGICSDAAFRPNTQQPVTNNIPEGIFRLFLNTLGTILAFTSYTLPIFTSFCVFEKFMCNFFNTERLFNERPIFEIHKFILVVISVGMAAFIPGLPLFLSLICSTAGVGLEFILPAIIYLQICGNNISRTKRIMVWSMGVMGIILMLFSMSLTGFTIMHVVYMSIV